MISKWNLDDRIKQELTLKANTINPSDEMLWKIIKRIENDKIEDKSMLNDSLSKIIMKRWIAISLCGILIFSGMLLAFSVEARAIALDAVNTIKTIFVLEKLEGKYEIVEKSSTDEILTPILSRGSQLSDAELTAKMGFTIRFPETLYGEYRYINKAEAVGVSKPVNADVRKQIEWDMIKATYDADVFNNLTDYEPYRNVFATYMSKKGNILFISIESSEVPLKDEATSITVETKVGGVNAAWVEEAYPNYKSIYENGIGKSDLYTKPEGISKIHYLTWTVNGVRYQLSTNTEWELTMEESVKIAESFMKGQK